MKIKGVEIRKVNEDILVFPRDDGDIVLKFRAVLNYNDFEKLYPEPKPPIRTGRGGVEIPKLDDPVYKDQLSKRNRSHTHWLVMQTLSATDDLSWEKIDPNDHTTWLDLPKEFELSGFTQAEVAMIYQKVFEVNSLDTEKVDAARERFLAQKRQQEQ